MISIRAHFDGKVIVPHGEINLPRDQALIIRVEPVDVDSANEISSLVWLSANAVESQSAPEDLSSKHDHYLYGSRKRNS